MAKLKLGNGMFIGKEELNYLVQSLKEHGYEAFFKHIVQSWGVGKSITDSAWNNFKVVPGSAVNQVSINAGYAFDSDMNIIYNEANAVNSVTIPADNIPRFLILSFEANNTLETGTVNVDISGGITGTGTIFESRLRGGTSFPSVIKFPDSALNTGEYRISNITSDIAGQLNVLANSMVAETNLKYQVVGTFTPGLNPPTLDKFPMIKNYWKVDVFTTDTSNNSTSFVLAQVVNNSGSITITDLRANSVFSAGGSGGGVDLITGTNKLIGWVKSTWNHIYSDLGESKVTLGWGLKSTTGNWSYNSGLQQLTISAASGGVWDTIGSFVPGDFVGWKIYLDEVDEELTVTNSVLSGSDIVLSISYTAIVLPTTSTIIVAPNADEVEFRIIPTITTYPNRKTEFVFPAHTGEANVLLPINTNYSIEWRHLKGTQVTPWVNTNISNPRLETQHDNDGNFTGGLVISQPAGTISTAFNSLNHATDKASRTQANTFTGSNIFDNELIIRKKFIFGQLNSVLSTMSPVNNFTIFDTHPGVLLKPVGTQEITGFTGGESGRLVMLQIDNSGSGSLVLKHNSTGSTAGNRLSLSNQLDRRLFSGDSIFLRYDVVSLTWNEVASRIQSRWTDLVSSPVFVGTNTSGITEVNKKSRYRWIDNNTLLVELNHTIEVSATTSLTGGQLSLSEITLPAGSSMVSNFFHLGLVTASSAGSHTSQESRPMFISTSGSYGVSFGNSFDSAEWEGSSVDYIGVRGSLIISIS